MKRRYYDPCDGSRTVAIRWRIASALNRSSRTCWANIVSWALGSRPLLDRFGDGDIRRTPSCFEPGQERCYCGKFANPVQTAPSPRLVDRG